MDNLEKLIDETTNRICKLTYEDNGEQVTASQSEIKWEVCEAFKKLLDIVRERQSEIAREHIKTITENKL